MLDLYKSFSDPQASPSADGIKNEGMKFVFSGGVGEAS